MNLNSRKVASQKRKRIHHPPKPSPAFSVNDPVDKVAYRMVFLDEWAQALSRVSPEFKKLKGRTVTEKVENLLYEHGWDGSWHTLLAQTYKYRSVRYQEHPVLKFLVEYNGIFWLAMWKCSNTPVSGWKQGSAWIRELSPQDDFQPRNG
jgi:hypothetical protein